MDEKSRLIAKAKRIMGAEATEWLNSPIGALGDRRPFDALDTEEGRAIVFSLLNRMDEEITRWRQALQAVNVFDIDVQSAAVLTSDKEHH